MLNKDNGKTKNEKKNRSNIFICIRNLSMAAAVCFAVPSVSSVYGRLHTGFSVTIFGTNFGTKNPAKTVSVGRF